MPLKHICFLPEIGGTGDGIQRWFHCHSPGSCDVGPVVGGVVGGGCLVGLGVVCVAVVVVVVLAADRFAHSASEELVDVETDPPTFTTTSTSSQP